MTRFSARPNLKSMLALVVAAASIVALTSATAPAEAETPVAYPKLGLPPAGANDWACQPTAERPFPAVIAHGTFGDQKSLLDNLSLALKSDGYCVYSLDYGDRATAPIEDSAAELDGFVDKVLASTAASKVEIVGHSQGGMMPRYYIKHLGGDALVEDLVGIAPSNHGSESQGSFSTAAYCSACAQQTAESDFLTALNNPDETPGPVDYTQVATTHDEVVVPYTSAFLAPGPQTTNITLQDRCPADPVEHVSAPMNPQAIAWVLNAFNREGPANAAAPIGCV